MCIDNVDRMPWKNQSSIVKSENPIKIGNEQLAVTVHTHTREVVHWEGDKLSLP